MTKRKGSRKGKAKKEGALFVICGSGVGGNYRHGVRVEGKEVEVPFVKGRFETADEALTQVLEAQAARPGALFARVE